MARSTTGILEPQSTAGSQPQALLSLCALENRAPREPVRSSRRLSLGERPEAPPELSLVQRMRPDVTEYRRLF